MLGIVTERTGQRDRAGLEGGLVEALLQTRTELREAKQFALADAIRERLEGLGVEVKDGPEGSTWRIS